MNEQSEESLENSNSDYKVFDLDNISIDSDNREAINYLKNVIDYSKSKPKCTYFEEDSSFVYKKTDKKYQKQPQAHQLMKQQSQINNKWQQDCINQFNNMKQNIERIRQWKQEVEEDEFLSSFINIDKQQEEQLSQMLQNFQLFKQHYSASTPTLLTMIQIDYSMAIKLLTWIIQNQFYDSKGLFWVYCLLTQIEDPIDGDMIANLNSIQTHCLKQRAFQQSQLQHHLDEETRNYVINEEAIYSIIVSIIQIEFKQNFKQ